MNQENKRGRGRPKKERTLQEEREAVVKELEGKRKRGRPTKEQEIEHKALQKTATQMVYTNKSHEANNKFYHPEIPDNKIARYNELNKYCFTIGRNRMNWQADDVEDEIYNRYDNLINKCIELEIEPNETLFACCLGIMRETLYTYMNENAPQHKSETVMNALRLCITTLVGALESKTLSNDVNVVGGIFILKNSRMGFKDQQDVIIQGADNSNKSTAELLSEADLLPDVPNFIDGKIDE